MESKCEYDGTRLRKVVQIVANNPTACWHISDHLQYSTPRDGLVVRQEPDLRVYPFFKIVHKFYKSRYRFYGRYTVFVSTDKKHWEKVIDDIIPKS